MAIVRSTHTHTYIYAQSSKRSCVSDYGYMDPRRIVPFRDNRENIQCVYVYVPECVFCFRGENRRYSIVYTL